MAIKAGGQLQAQDAVQRDVVLAPQALSSCPMHACPDETNARALIKVLQ
ncbi:hypothetical protein XOCgx_3391 [Xanthomonas oryzae pv. oryzicola]|nr:hypothetical protein XOCgx_3391 [Xanthomonas oryzae pv. oryzicola]